MSIKPLLAKSPQNGREVTLAQHTDDVLRSLDVMFGEPGRPTRLAQEWLRFFRLGEDSFAAFLANLRLAAALHDLGKASSSYQQAIRHGADQILRHEHLSALLIWQAPLRGWLRSIHSDGVDPEIVAAAVVSHHLKVNDKGFSSWMVDSTDAKLFIYLDAPDVEEVLRMAAVRHPAAPPAGLKGIPRVWDRDFVTTARQAFESDMAHFSRILRSDPHRHRLLLAVKAALIGVDSAGSALLRVGYNLSDWLASAFQQPLLTDKDVQDGIINPRVEELMRQGRWKGFHDFQRAAADLGPRALLLAGCGTGKTLAAWNWIAARLRHRPVARIIFLYPTRATATEGFRDYVSWAGPTVGRLMHGTARYDLEGMFENPRDPRSGGDYTVPERLFALGYWHGQIFSATVDSFLAFITNRYAALCLLPLLVDSVVVFDEVHSFDQKMFRALERFLEFFDVPVLCMTASLPSDRLKVLRGRSHLEVFPGDPGQFADLQRQAQLPRYRIHWVSEEEAAEQVQLALSEGKKILWVTNTVARCQKVAARLTRELGQRVPVTCYHSRFRLSDRRSRHRAAISLLAPGTRGPAVLVTTQVCEMSLDLDADVLMSEAAGVPSLIQRMGRCCREPMPPPGRTGEIYVYAPPDCRPYEDSDVREGIDLARSLSGSDPVSLATLSDYLTHLPPQPFAAGGFTSFLDSGWYAMGSDDAFRDDDNSTRDCVLDTDRDTYLEARARGDWQADGFIIPVPRRFAYPCPRLGRYLFEAPAARYDKELGFLTDEVVCNA